MTRRRLAVITDYAWPTGGVEEFVCELVSRAAPIYECRVVSWSPQTRLPPGFDGLRIVECGDIRGLWDELDAADAILIATSFNVRLLARAAADYLGQCRAPAIVSVQTSDHSSPSSASLVQEAWLTALAKGCHRVVAVSDEVAVALERLAEFPKQRITVIENAARLQSHGRSQRKRGRSRVSFIGRPQAQKGYHLFERLAIELSGAGLRFAANTVSLEPERRLPGVEYSHLLSDADLVQFFDDADLIVAPYLRADGLPLALLEALNCGTPVMGFDVPGVGALLKRHGQLALDPDFETLRSSVEAWHQGLLHVEAPRPGSVQTWSEQIQHYLDLLADAETAC